MKFGLFDLFCLFGLATALVELSEGVVSIGFDNVNWSYNVPITIGSLGQIVYVQIDTCAADSWVLSNDVICGDHINFRTKHCKNCQYVETRPATATYTDVPVDGHYTEVRAAETCLANGYFDQSSSNSFAANSSDFERIYLDTSFAIGSFGNDIVKFDDFEVGLSFAIVNFTDCFIGTLGLGFAELEESQELYDNFPLVLKNQGKISKRLYSLYSNDKKGSLLFGGVDHAKYVGELQTVPMVSMSPNGKIYRPVIILSGLNIESDEETITVFDTFNLAVILDTSMAISYIDESVFVTILSVLGYRNHGTPGNAALELLAVPCPADSSIILEFDFSGAKLIVPLADLLMVKDGTCYLTLSTTTANNAVSYSVFGTNILKHGYFVFDLEDEEVAIAQAKDTDVKVIEAVISTIPSARKAPNYSSTGFPERPDNAYTNSQSSIISSYATTTQLPENYISNRYQSFNQYTVISVPKLAHDIRSDYEIFSTMANSTTSSSKLQNSLKTSNLISSTSSTRSNLLTATRTEFSSPTSAHASESTQTNLAVVTSTKFSSSSVDASESTTSSVTESLTNSSVTESSSNTDNTTSNPSPTSVIASSSASANTPSNPSPTSGSTKHFISFTIFVSSLMLVSFSLL